MNLAVDRSGDVYYEKKPVTMSELFTILTNRFHANTNLPVYISGDKDTSHGAMVNVLDFVRKAGVQNTFKNERLKLDRMGLPVADGQKTTLRPVCPETRRLGHGLGR